MVERLMADKPQKTVFDALCWTIRGFTLFMWVAVGLVMYMASYAHESGGPAYIWQEKLAIGTVFVMSIALWWFSGFVARKGREKEAARAAREAEDS